MRLDDFFYEMEESLRIAKVIDNGIRDVDNGTMEKWITQYRDLVKQKKRKEDYEPSDFAIVYKIYIMLLEAMNAGLITSKECNELTNELCGYRGVEK